MSELEREKFEAQLRAEFPKLSPHRLARGTRRYIDIEVQRRWEGWLARSESAPSLTRESLHAEWMAQEKYLDWSNFLLHKLTGQAAPSDLHSQEFQSALGKLALAMGNPCIEFEAGKIEIGLIKYATEFINRSQSEPGESAPATPISHDVLAGAAVAGRHEKAATADPGQRSTVGPEDIQGEAGSPAPAGCPQCGSVNRDYCNPECSNIFTRNEWHRLAAPAPTEEK